MRLFPPEMAIDPKEGFTPEKDIFGRKSFGDQLTRLIVGLDSPAVLLLDAPWGTGKSTFVKMWRGELVKSGIPSIYFDAFANDYQEDAFLAVASHIIADAEKQKSRVREALDSFKQQALNTAKVLGWAALRIGVRAATAGMLEAEALADAVSEIAKGAGEKFDEIVDEALKARLDNHESDRKIFDNFRVALEQLAASLSQSNRQSDAEGQQDNISKPLVIIIDELDRCRPTFALELLEKIKHFFSVPGVTFLLVSSLSQLEAAVSFAYGDLDARTYLEKFYNLRILFPAGRPDRPDMSTKAYLNFLGCNRNITEIVDEFSRAQSVSLRTLERIAAYSKIIQLSLPTNGFWQPAIIAVLCIIRVVYPEIYGRLRRSDSNFMEIRDAMNFDLWRSEYQPDKRSGLSERVEIYWQFAFGELRNENARMLASDASKFNLEPLRIIPYFCELADGFSFPDAPE